MHRLVLIARREFVAYASVPSFWVALLMGPVLMTLTALALKTVAPHPGAVQQIAVESSDQRLSAVAGAALTDAAQLEHRAIRIVAPGRGAQVTVGLTQQAGGVDMDVRGGRLSPVALALLKRDLASATVDENAGRMAPVRVSQPAAPAAPPADPGRFTRFSMTVLLWLVLVGSLGMLLQAVVRERSNRSLEALLSSVRPADLLMGKLIGVGALSVLVVATWLIGGAAVALSPLAAGQPGVRMLFHGFVDLPTLASAGGLFLMAFGMYGSALIALSALARDVPAAQNLSRPVFGLLLLIFFIALAQFGGVGDTSLPALALFPPFTPFVLLLARPGAVDLLHAWAGVAGMAATTWLCTRAGAQVLCGEAPFWSPRRPRPVRA